jgi:hypothetical protein
MYSVNAPGAGKAGYCRRNPPAVIPIMMPQARSPSNPEGAPMLTVQGFFPPVKLHENWCGEFKSLVAESANN